MKMRCNKYIDNNNAKKLKIMEKTISMKNEKYTIKTLIEQLQKHPSDTPVCIMIGDSEYAEQIISVDLHEDVENNKTGKKSNILVLWVQ